jgi:LAO/AO transport system kinase
MSAVDEASAELFALARAGDRRATGRLLSLVERGGATADEVDALVHAAGTAAQVVGITGAPGAGKSTLTGRLLGRVIETGRRPAVVAVDPSSPLTGGAILGDRLRMEAAMHPSAFIRSMATRGPPGGLALALPGSVRVLAAVGYDPVIVETVGVGQTDVDVAGAVDTTVVIVTPGWGDAIQANKAGLLELADVYVVNKADRPGADDTRRDLELMLDLSTVSGAHHHDDVRPPVVMTSATSGTGIDELWDAIDGHFARLRDGGGLEARRTARVRDELRHRVERLAAVAIDVAMSDADTAALIDAVRAGSCSPAAAAQALYERAGRVHDT